VTGISRGKGIDVFGISGIEFLFIAVLVLIIFGPDKMPQFGRTIGRVMRQFNQAKDQMEHVVRSEMYGGGSDSTSSSPFSPSSPFAAAPAATQEAPQRRSDVDFVEDEEEEEEE